MTWCLLWTSPRTTWSPATRTPTSGSGPWPPGTRWLQGQIISVDADLFLYPAAQHDGPHGRRYRGPGADDAGRHLLLRLHGERDTDPRQTCEPCLVQVRLWDLERGRCVIVLSNSDSFCRCVAFTGNRIVAGDFDGIVHFWEIAFSPDDK